jgi:hypothetical protein
MSWGLSMPFAVLVVVLLQCVLAVTFVVLPVVGARHGPAAQRAAETDVARQGFRVTVLAERGVNFGASRGSVVVAVAIGVCFATLAVLNLVGSDLGRVLTWALQSLLFVAGLVIMPGEVFTARYVGAAFRKAGLQDIDVRAFVGAASAAYPSWLRLVVLTRFLLTTVGSVLVVVLLVLPAANAYYR